MATKQVIKDYCDADKAFVQSKISIEPRKMITINCLRLMAKYAERYSNGL